MLEFTITTSQPIDRDDYGFTCEVNEDWSFKCCKFNKKKIDKALWEAIFKMRWDMILYHRKYISEHKKKLKIAEQRETYKAEMQNMEARNHRQKQDNKYQKETCELYKNILKKLVN